jgi:uncharacterized protein
LIDRFLNTLAHISLRHARPILVIAAIVAILAIGGTFLLDFDPDLLNLIPQHNRELNEFKYVLAKMGTIDYHIAIVDIPPGHEPGEYESLIEALARGYDESPLVADVMYRVPNPVEMIDDVLPRALLFLTPQELDQVAARLSDEQIRETVARNRALLRTPQAMALKDIVRYDPLNLLPIYLEKFRSAGGGFRVDISSGYYLSQDRQTLLILTKPVRPAQDIPFARSLVDTADEIEEAAVRQFREASPDLPLPRISYTGGYSIALNDAELIRKDVTANILFSFFGVLALFIYAFRRAASIAYAGIPMALALAMTFGLAGLVYGTLSSASAGFAALLAGLGIDLITVMYGRYVDERNRGVAMQPAIRTVMRKTLPGVFVAAITTSATFFAFLATDFRGMRQLGFLTGIGILFFLLAVTFVLPALIVTSEGKAQKRAPRLFLHSFGSHHLIHWSIRHRRTAIAVWLVFLVICGAAATRLRFSDRIQDLRAGGNAGVMAQERLTKKFGQSFDFMMHVVEGPTLDETLAKSHEASTTLDRLAREGVIGSYQSITTFLPPEGQQREVIRLLDEGSDDRFDAERITTTFREAAIANGFRPETWDDYLELFTEALEVRQPVSLDDVESDALRRLSSRFVRQTPGGWMGVTYIYPAGEKWERTVPDELMAMRESPDGRTILTGVNLVSQTLRGIVKADAVRATLIGFLGVAFLIFLSFRSVRLTIMAFVPVTAGAAGMLGLMAAFGLEFNFMNIFVGVMIIGVATDYALYMIDRFKEDPERFPETAEETGKAVVMAAITSIVGYGSFALSHYPGLRSIGYATSFGVGLSGLAAITLLPALLTSRIFSRKWRQERRSDIESGSGTPLREN